MNLDSPEQPVQSRAGRWTGLIVSLVCVGFALFVGGMSQPDAWFAALAKPSWNPPNWVFAPVWTCLYVMMAVAAWLVWLRRFDHGLVWIAIGLFAAQLVLNGAWSWMFFDRHDIQLALADILALDIMVLVVTVMFFRIRALAGWLMVPYLAWILFATCLNYSILMLNGGPTG